MARRRSAKKVNAEVMPQESVRARLMNNLNIGMGTGIGGGYGITGFFPFNQGTPWTPQISDVNTSFINLRWYLVSNFRQFLSEAYVEIGLVQTIVNVPVDDGLRGGITIKSNELDEEQIEALNNSMDRDDDINTAGQAEKWNRLFGGAGILILTDQDPRRPLNLQAINKDSKLEFRAVDMWELTWDKQTSEGYDPTVGEEDFNFYNYYGEQVHKSRVMRLKGITAPSFIRPRLRGWGFSVVETLIRSMNQYLKATDVAFEVMDEFKIDIYKVKNYTASLLSGDAANKINKRIAHTNYLKNYQNSIVMDTEDDYQQKQLTFGGLGEVMQQIRMQVASDMRMPMLKLFGTPATGLNASDESSLEVYNAMVESEVRNKLKYPILRMLEIKCQMMFGFIPSDLKIEFEPLRVLSAVDQETVKTQKFNRLRAAFEAGTITLEEYRDACNKGNLFDVTLDPDKVYTTGYMQDRITAGFGNPYVPSDVDNPGANRIDTRRPTAFEEGGIPKGGPLAVPPAPDSSDAPVKMEAVPRTNHIEKYNLLEKTVRLMTNSAQFDKASYEADGGDDWIDARKAPMYDIENPGNVDEALWRKAKESSQAALGEIRWQFVVYMYKKMGGRFNNVA